MSYARHAELAREVLKRLGYKLRLYKGASFMPKTDRMFDDAHQNGKVVHLLWGSKGDEREHGIGADFSSNLWHEVGHAFVASSAVHERGVDWQATGAEPLRRAWADLILSETGDRYRDSYLVEDGIEAAAVQATHALILTIGMPLPSRLRVLQSVGLTEEQVEAGYHCTREPDRLRRVTEGLWW